MNTNTGEPTATQISLTYDEDTEQWLARDETREVTVGADTGEKALEALKGVLTNAGDIHGDLEIDQDDPFFPAPTYSSGQSDISENVDGYLAEETYQNKLGPK